MNTESKIFDTSTVEGIGKADQYKNRLNNKYNKVAVTVLGWNRVRIEGSEPIGRARHRHIPHNPDVMQTVCETCGKEMDLRPKQGRTRKAKADRAEFARRINPAALNFSPKMVAIVGAIIGHDYGVRDGRGRQLTGLSITSDGFVIAETTPVSSGTFLGDAADLQRNIDLFISEIKYIEDRAHFRKLYQSNVKDWRK